MKKILLALFLTIPVMLAFAVSVSSRDAAAPMVRITRFQGMPIKGVAVTNCILELVNSSNTITAVELPEDLQPYLILEIGSDGIVTIGLRNVPRNIQQKYRGSSVKATVNAKDIRSIQASGASRINCSGAFQASGLDVMLSGASVISGLNHTASGNTDIKISGAGKIIDQSRFNAAYVKLMVSGSSLLDQLDVRGSESVNLTLSGASKYLGNMYGENIGVTISGASDFDGEIRASELTLGATGASRITSNITCNVFKANVVGSSELTLALNGSQKAEFTVSSASSVNVSGNTLSLRLSAGSASKFNGGNFTADSAWINASSASNVNLTVNSELSVSASGASSVKYRGNPRIISQSATSGSNIRRE